MANVVEAVSKSTKCRTFSARVHGLEIRGVLLGFAEPSDWHSWWVLDLDRADSKLGYDQEYEYSCYEDALNHYLGLRRLYG